MSTISKSVSTNTGDERQTLSTETLAKTVQAAMRDMSMVQNNAQMLRSSVERLGLDLGLTGNDEQQEAANELAKRRAETRHRLNGLGKQSHELRSVADALDSQLREQYRRLSGHEASADLHEQTNHVSQTSLQTLGHKFAATQDFSEFDHQRQEKLSEESEGFQTPGKRDVDQAKKAAEDAQFAELEKETMKIQSWFQQLKQIKQEKDALREKKLETAKAAKELGLSDQEIADRLQHVEDSKANTVNHAGTQDEAKTPSALIQVEESQTLGAVLARSASEMESIETAARDVMTGFQEFNAWKQLGDTSRQSVVMGLIAKEKMGKRLESLKQNEEAINHRINQLHRFLGTSAHPSA
jgi:chaperonin cofactor prefoldin